MAMTPRQIRERFEKLQSIRQNWEDYWQELAEFFMPRKSTVTVEQTRGNRRNSLLLDNTGLMSNELLSGALHSLLTNPHRIFFELFTGDKDLDDDDDVREWLQDSTLRMHNVLNNSNFQTEISELYSAMGVFGTGSMFIADDPDKVVRFKAQFIRNLFIAENNLGVIDEVHRKFKWNAKNIIQEFGEKGMHEQVMKAFDKQDQREFQILHAVYPDKIKKTTSAKAMPFVSQWVLLEFNHDLRVGRFREFPYVVPRWTKGSDEIYGRSPAMNALPEMKTLNKMVETVIKASQKVIDPPLSVPDDGFIFPIRTRPGSINVRRSGSQDRIEPIFNAVPIDFGFQALEERRNRIREAFFIDQLKLREGPQMTATEVEQRTEESMRLLGPILGRQQNELLRPMIDRIFNMMLRKDLFLPTPQKLDGKELQVQYSSLIARAQRINEGRNIIRGIEAMAPFLQIDPNAADIIDGDNAVKEIARIFSVPQTLIRNKKEVEAIREARAQAQQEEAEAEDRSREADVISKTGQTLAAVQSSGG